MGTCTKKEQFQYNDFKDCCTSHYVQQPPFITLLHAISHATAHFVTFLFIKIYYLSIIRYSYLFVYLSAMDKVAHILA